MAKDPNRAVVVLFGLAAAAVTSPLFFLFQEQGRSGTGRAAWMCALMFIMVIKGRWDLKSRPWFWGAIAVLLAFHVPFVLYVPWTSRWIPAPALLPIGVLDVAVYLGCIALIQKAIKGAHSSKKSA